MSARPGKRTARPSAVISSTNLFEPITARRARQVSAQTTNPREDPCTIAGTMAAMSKIRVGIVGATVTRGGSGWGANAHIPALKALDQQYELTAVCTAHRETAEASKEAF